MPLPIHKILKLRRSIGLSPFRNISLLIRQFDQFVYQTEPNKYIKSINPYIQISDLNLIKPSKILSEKLFTIVLVTLSCVFPDSKFQNHCIILFLYHSPLSEFPFVFLILFPFFLCSPPLIPTIRVVERKWAESCSKTKLRLLFEASSPLQPTHIKLLIQTSSQLFCWYNLIQNMLRSTFVLALLILSIVGLMQCQPISQGEYRLGFLALK